ncbi:MAG: peptidoglycan-binding protein [Gemmatimonadetes bacterium]|nr:peptidoglycan-binding protein [Gemmatimonadota bacterium]
MHVEICDNEAAVRAAANWVRGVASKGAPALTSSPFLEYGMQGEAVKELQRVLNCWYPSLTPLVEDGDFGAATKARVEYFQKAAGLTVDGIVGPATRKGLGL